MKTKNIKISVSGIVSSLVALYWWPLLALAQTTGATQDTLTRCQNFQKQFNGLFSWVDTSKFCSASELAIFVIQTLINFSGVVVILFLIVGGFFYLTSAGNEEQTEKGKKILVNSVIGLVVIILAYSIVAVIGSVVTAGK